MSNEIFTLIFLMFLYKSDLRISTAVNKHERIIRINTKPGKTAKYNFHIIDQKLVLSSLHGALHGQP